MTSLNSRLQLALLNRKKGRNALEKGFTLVELMIVIVIVGILSAIALPNFLGQTVKAKATECNTKGGALLSQVAAEHLYGQTEGNALFSSKVGTDTTDSKFCTFTVTTNSSAASGGTPATSLYVLGIAGKGDLLNKYVAQACIDAATGKRDLVYVTANTGTATLGSKVASCT